MFISTRGRAKLESLPQSEDSLMKYLRKHLVLTDAAQSIASKNGKGQLISLSLFSLFNLLVCAAFERHLRSDPTAITLGYFFVVEFALYGASLLAQYQRLTFPVLERSTIFPFSSFAALMFCVWSDLRRPVAIVFLLMSVLLLGFVYRSSVGQIGMTIIIFLLLLITIEIVFVMWALLLRRNPHPEMTLILSFVAMSLTAFVLAGFLGGGSTVGFLPFTSWAARGIVAISAGSFGTALGLCLLLLTTSSISAIVAAALYRRT